MGGAEWVHWVFAGVFAALAVFYLIRLFVSDPGTSTRGVDAARLRAEWHESIEMVLAIMDQRVLLERDPSLARSIRNRFPYLDALNHMQLDLLRRYRAGDSDEQVVQGIHLTINGIAAGLRNSG